MNLAVAPIFGNIHVEQPRPDCCSHLHSLCKQVQLHCYRRERPHHAFPSPSKSQSSCLSSCQSFSRFCGMRRHEMLRQQKHTTHLIMSKHPISLQILQHQTTLGHRHCLILILMLCWSLFRWSCHSKRFFKSNNLNATEHYVTCINNSNLLAETRSKSTVNFGAEESS